MPGTHIYSIGAGLRVRDHLSLEGLRALRASKLVLYFGELEGLAELLKEEGLEGRELSGAAHFGEPRKDTYARVAEDIISAARMAAPVAWVTQGHPSILDGVTAHLAGRAPQEGLGLRRIMGLSSVDAMLLDLELDVGQSGLQVFDATRVLLLKIAPNPRVPCLLLQVARAETGLNVLDARLRPAALTRLRDQLLQTYPESHPCFLVTSARQESALPVRLEAPLGRLEQYAASVAPWTSIYLPPAGPDAVPAPEELRRLMSYERLEQLYETPLERYLELLARGAQEDPGGAE
jgi:uncharacterized protein YabN with tetrapyrrole methylase and pyrophosphatase domain